MAEDVSLYQALVGRVQGGGKFYIKSGGVLESAGEVEFASGGELEMLSGSVMDCQSGFSFYFEDSEGEITAQNMKILTADRIRTVTYGPASVSTAVQDFSVVNLPSIYGVVNLSMTSQLPTPSFYLTSCVAGQDAWIRMLAGSTVCGVINILGSGCSLVNAVGYPITSISLYNSAASIPAIHVHCFQDDEWTVIDVLGDGVTYS